MTTRALTWIPTLIPQTEKQVPVLTNEFACIGQWNRVHNQLNSFASYENNWNGLGADKPDGNTLETAYECLLAFQKLEAPAPTVATIGPDGSISIEWRNNNEYLQAEFGSEPRVEIVKFGPNRPIERWSVPLKKRDAGNYTWVSYQPSETEEGAAGFVATR